MSNDPLTLERATSVLSSNMLYGTAIGATGLFLAGVAFAYYVALPPALDFLLNFGDGDFAFLEEDSDDNLNFRAKRFAFSEGRVGIGTAAPTARLDVLSSGETAVRGATDWIGVYGLHQGDGSFPGGILKKICMFSLAKGRHRRQLRRPRQEQQRRRSRRPRRKHGERDGHFRTGQRILPRAGHAPCSEHAAQCGHGRLH